MSFFRFLLIASITTGCAAATTAEIATSASNFDEESGEKPPIPAATLRTQAEDLWRARHDADWIHADSVLVYQVNGDAVTIGEQEKETLEVQSPDGISSSIEIEMADAFVFRTLTDKDAFSFRDPRPGTYPCADFRGKLELKTASGVALASDPAACTMTIDTVSVDRPEYPVSLVMKPRKIYTGTIVATMASPTRQEVRAGFVMVQNFF